MDNIEKKALITDLIEGVTKTLRDQKYSSSTLGAYSATWNKYLAYSPTEYYDPSVADDFLEDFYFITLSSSKQHLDSTMRHARRHIYVLDEYYRTGKISRRVTRYARPVDQTLFEYFFKSYLDYSEKMLYSESWFSNTKLSLNLLLKSFQDMSVSSFDEITGESIAHLIDVPCDTCANVRRQWIYQRGYVEMDYSHFVPDIRREPTKLPMVWNDDEIEKILAAIDTANPTGKRNYAIFLLLARTGLRISDVVSLQFSDIDWSNNCLRIVQIKTGKEIAVPFSKEIGIAIIDYLKHGRPASNSGNVFLSHTAPFQPIAQHNNLSKEFKHYIRRAGLSPNGKKPCGIHSLRSSFATNLMKSGASLQDVSQSLGHSDVNVAAVYLRLDVDQLRMCAMPSMGGGYDEKL